ncbi:MAG: T9SS type A sorting domain-containing protein [Flavobacteriales bacterium]|nr:T9SS type A sorting domain-containing protein [Flavobacteriales bacterium]
MTEMGVGVRERASRMSVQPNPVRDRLVAELPEGTHAVEIISMDGRLPYRTSSRSTALRIDTISLTVGAYLQRATQVDGIISVEPFMKH